MLQDHRRAQTTGGENHEVRLISLPSAMVEGMIAGYAVAESLGYDPEKAAALKADAVKELQVLRSGPMGAKIRAGLEKEIAKGGRR